MTCLAPLEIKLGSNRKTQADLHFRTLTDGVRGKLAISVYISSNMLFARVVFYTHTVYGGFMSYVHEGVLSYEHTVYGGFMSYVHEGVLSYEHTVSTV